MAMLDWITTGFDFLTEDEEREQWRLVPRSNAHDAHLAEEEYEDE